MDNEKTNQLQVPAQKVEELVKSVLDGTASENQSGLVLRTLQMAVSGALVTGMSDMLNSLNEYENLTTKVKAKYIEKIETELEADTITLESLQKIMDGLHTKKLQLLDLYRKVAQGKELFPTDVISEEEKKVLKLLKSFKSDADKKKFIELCEQTFSKPKEDNDFNDE